MINSERREEWVTLKKNKKKQELSIAVGAGSGFGFLWHVGRQCTYLETSSRYWWKELGSYRLGLEG